MKESNDLSQHIRRLNEIVERLEKRVQHIESYLKLKGGEFRLGSSEAAKLTSRKTAVPQAVEEEKENLEFQIGQFWLGRIGVFTLTLGLMFLYTLISHAGHPFTATALGYFFVIILGILAHYLKKDYVFFPLHLIGGAMALTIFVTLKLHYLTDVPVLKNEILTLILIYLFIAANLVISVRLSSIPLIMLNIVMGIITAFIANHSVLIFAVLLSTAIFSVYLRVKLRSKTGFLFLMLLTYFSHLLWLINCPMVTGELKLVLTNPENLYFLVGYLFAFALGNILRPDKDAEDHLTILSSFVNSGVGFVLLSVITFFHQAENLVLFHLLISMAFLGLASVFWITEKSRYSTFFYSIAAYLALTITIVAHFKIPNAFIWLSWQSLLVVTTALWFRSKIIVLANFFIFLIILLAFLILAGEISMVSISFGLVAILSARVMNWQKQRLMLRTEFMRNAYLVVAFFVFPWTLYHSVPQGYVAISWIVLALGYYSLSVILKIPKYRWMALSTLLLTALYVILLGIFRLTPEYRVLSLLGLGLVLLVISLLYTRFRAKSSKEE